MKVVFITGGNSGIGKAIVNKFLDNNISVGILDIENSSFYDSLPDSKSKRLLYMKGDVTKISDIKSAVEKTYNHFGQIDTVIANAGIHKSDSIFDIEEEGFLNVMNINLKGVIFTIKESLPYLNKEESKIILIGSDQSFIGKPNNLSYGACKGAIGQITKSLSIELAPFGVSVNAVCPSTIDTPLTQNALQNWADREFNGNYEKAYAKEKHEFPVGRIGSCDEVAEMIYFLSEKSTRFTTGSLFLIDGGYTAK